MRSARKTTISLRTSLILFGNFALIFKFRSQPMHSPNCMLRILPAIRLLCTAVVGTGIAFLNPRNKSFAAVYTLTSQVPWRFMRRVTFAISLAVLSSFKPFCNSKKHNSAYVCSNSLPTIRKRNQLIIMSAFLPKAHRANRVNH